MRTIAIDAEVPESRRIEIELPPDVPVGPAEMVLVIHPAVRPASPAESVNEWLSACDEVGFEAGRTDLSARKSEFTGRRF